MVRRLINQNFVLIACIVTLHAFSWLIFYSIEDRSRPVLDLPISVSPAGRVVADINIKYFRGYDLNLVFDREGHSVEEILRDIGTTYFIGRDKYLDELQEFSWRERYLKNIEEYYIVQNSSTCICSRRIQKVAEKKCRCLQQCRKTNAS